MLARLDGGLARARLEVNFGVGRKKSRRQLNDLMNRRRDLQMCADLARHHLIYENPPMLRVILKLDDVKVTVVGFQQMCLCAAPHFANEPEGVYGHAVCRKRKSVAEENIT